MIEYWKKKKVKIKDDANEYLIWFWRYLQLYAKQISGPVRISRFLQIIFLAGFHLAVRRHLYHSHSKILETRHKKINTFRY